MALGDQRRKHHGDEFQPAYLLGFLMKRISTALAFCLWSTWALAWSYGGTQDPVNVWAYLSPAEQTDVRNCGRATDIRNHINDAITALNTTTGGQLYFPPGCYVSSTCNFTTITVPVLISGAGPSVYNLTSPPTKAGSQIECGSTNTPVFKITSDALTIRDIGIVDTSGAPASGSSAILIDSGHSGQRTIIENSTFFGFYDTADLKQVEGSYIGSNGFWGCSHWCLRLRNTVTADEGDFNVAFNNFYPMSGAAAAVEYESGGGGKFTSNKIVGNNATFVDGFHQDFTGQVTTQTEYLGNMIEGGSGIPINIVAGIPYIEIIGGYLNASTGVNSAIFCGNCSYSKIDPGVAVGASGAAVTFSNSNHMTVGCFQLNGFTSRSTGGSSIETCSETP